MEKQKVIKVESVTIVRNPNTSEYFTRIADKQLRVYYQPIPKHEAISLARAFEVEIEEDEIEQQYK